MRPTFFEELKGMKRNNEFREMILMQAAKKMLADKKKKVDCSVYLQERIRLKQFLNAGIELNLTYI